MSVMRSGFLTVRTSNLHKTYNLYSNINEDVISPTYQNGEAE